MVIHLMKKTIFIAVLFLISALAKGQTSPYYCEQGIAISGYDAVAYFMQNSAVKGNVAFSYQWNNAQWLFSSQSHLDLFKKNPEKYAPQYGGWCAYGVSENHKSPTDPKAFTISGDKLYLNYNTKVMQLWRRDTTKHINLANQHWPALKHGQ
jgi:YHS domain-containing protein